MNSITRTADDSRARLWAAQIVLALGGLFLGTTEFAAMGLLPNIAQTFDVDVPTAGHLISAYARCRSPA